MGNATADLVAEQARILPDQHRTPPPLPLERLQQGFVVTHDSAHRSLDSIKEIQAVISDRATSRDRATDWSKSSQGSVMATSVDPLADAKFYNKETRDEHVGTIADILASTITKPSYLAPEEEVLCEYCRRHKRREVVLSMQHVLECRANNMAQRACHKEVRRLIVSSWAPDWTWVGEPDDLCLARARNLS